MTVTSEAAPGRLHPSPTPPPGDGVARGGALPNPLGLARFACGTGARESTLDRVLTGVYTTHIVGSHCVALILHIPTWRGDQWSVGHGQSPCASLF